MKTNNILGKMSNLSLFVAAAGIMGLTSCDKEDMDDTGDTYAISGSASGAQMVPAVTTSATGSISGSYNEQTNLMQYNISWSGLSAAASDSIAIYGPAAAGANGNLVGKVAVTSGGVGGSAIGAATLTEAEETALLDNDWYFVIGNDMYTDGEIRGQINVTRED